MSDLYDADIVTWSERQADLLRRRAAGELMNEAEIDWPNVAEEIHALGKNQGRELASRIGVILLHLVRLQTSPATEPRASWRETVRRERDEIEELLADAPSLRARVPAVIDRRLPGALTRALQALADNGETPRMDPGLIAYSEDQVLGEWLPGE